jgi:hypothetical protein
VLLNLFCEVLSVGCRVFSEPVDDVKVLAGSFVLDSGLVVSGVEFKDRETRNHNSFSFVDSSIELSDDQIRSGNLFSNFNPLGSHSTAVTTPGGVVLNKNVLSLVHDDFVMLRTDNNLYGAVVCLRDISGFESGAEDTIVEIIHEMENLIRGQVGH